MKNLDLGEKRKGGKEKLKIALKTGKKLAYFFWEANESRMWWRADGRNAQYIPLISFFHDVTLQLKFHTPSPQKILL